MPTTNIIETTVQYRAAFRHAQGFGSTYINFRETAEEAWVDVDRCIAQGHRWPGEWVVEKVTTVTTSEDLHR